MIVFNYGTLSMTFAKNVPSISRLFFFYEYGVDYSCATTCSSLDLCCNIHLFRQVQSYTCGFVVLSYTWLFSLRCARIKRLHDCLLRYYLIQRTRRDGTIISLDLLLRFADISIYIQTRIISLRILG